MPESMHITSCSRDSRETLKYGTFGRKKFGFRAMSRRILKLCVASLLNILCFTGMMKTFLETLTFFCRSLSSWCYSSSSVPCVRRFPIIDDHQDDMMMIFKVEATAINHHKPSWFTNDIDMITVIVNLREPSARSDLVERGAISR